VVIGNYYFSESAEDLSLLQHIADVAALLHAPFIAAAAPGLLGLRNDFSQLAAMPADELRRLGGDRWRQFRTSTSSRYVGLVLPRFLLRALYTVDGEAHSGLRYHETIAADEHALWANGAWAFAIRIVDSFAKYRWCPNIVGRRGSKEGAVDSPVNGPAGLSLVECQVSERRDFELSEAGFIPLRWQAGSEPWFGWASSCLRVSRRTLERANRQSELNARLMADLPYVFMVSRFCHYLPVLCREMIGKWLDVAAVKRGLEAWLAQWAVPVGCLPIDRAGRCLRESAISVRELPGRTQMLEYQLRITPWFKAFGQYLELSASGRLEAYFESPERTAEKEARARRNAMVKVRFDKARALGEAIHAVYRASLSTRQANPDNETPVGDEDLLELACRQYATSGDFRALWDEVKGEPPAYKHLQWLALWRTL